MDSIYPCACGMMQIKKTKLPMKNNKTAKARLRGARPVCFDGKFIGYDLINPRKALGIPENASLPAREEADAAWRQWEKEHGEQFHEEFEAETVKEQTALNRSEERRGGRAVRS